MSKKQVTEKIVTKGAGLIMEQLYESGIYQESKQLEADMESVKEILKERMGSKEVLDFPLLKVVVKKQTYCRYVIDYVGLNEFLHQRGLLVEAARFGYKDLKKEKNEILGKLSLFKNPLEQSVRMNPNAQGKVALTQKPFSTWTDNELVLYWTESKRRLERILAVIGDAREEMLACPFLRKEKRLSCSFGSVSIFDLDPTYNTPQIYEFLGADFVIQHSKADMQKILNEYISDGLMTFEEFNRFRTAKDIFSKFVIEHIEQN